MNINFNTEKEQLDFMRSVYEPKNTLLYNKNKKSEKILKSIMSPENWINSAENGAGHVPPDFYNTQEKIMIDIMKVDDVGEKKGKRNINYIQNKKILSKIQKSTNLKNIKNIIINADTTLIDPKNHHNYEKYVKNVNRIIKKHIDSIPLYKKNHPECKILIFLIFDETSGLYYRNFKNEKPCTLFSTVHLPIMNPELTAPIMKNTDINYLLWFSPYAYAEYINENDNKKILTDLPKIMFIENKDLKKGNLFDYNKKIMKSTEL